MRAFTRYAAPQATAAPIRKATASDPTTGVNP